VLVTHDNEEGTMNTAHATITKLSSRVALWVCLALLATAAVAQVALAGGEPKNEPPFTRHVGRSIEHAKRLARTSEVPRGESKNDTPFVRRVRTSATG
jgi:hypothetical protein